MDVGCCHPNAPFINITPTFRLQPHMAIDARAGIPTTVRLFTVIDFNDNLTSCIMMPLGALGMALFVGWYLPRNGKEGVLSADKGIKHWAKKAYIQVLRWLVPAAILIIFLNSLGII